MATRLDLLTIMVEDMPRMVAFYTSGLGFAIKKDRGGWVSLENEGVRLALWERRALKEQFPEVQFSGPVNGSFVLAITYASILALKQAYTDAVGQGAMALGAPVAVDRWEMWSAWIGDPEGNLIELTWHA